MLSLELRIAGSMKKIFTPLLNKINRLLTIIQLGKITNKCKITI